MHPGLVFANRQMVPDNGEVDSDSDDEEYELGEGEDVDDEVSGATNNDDLSQPSEEDIAPLPNNVDNNDVINDHVDNNDVTSDQAPPEENIVDVNADLINGQAPIANEPIVKVPEPADEHMEIPGVGNDNHDLMEIPGVGNEQDDDVSHQGDGNYDPVVNPLEDPIADPEEEDYQNNNNDPIEPMDHE